MEQALIGKTYSILRSRRDHVQSRTIDTVVESGLSWEDADRKRDSLNEIERKANPLKSCWTRDVFIVQMEASDGASNSKPKS